MTKLTTTISVEVEIEVSGTFLPADESVGAAEGYEDLEVTGLTFSVFKRRANIGYYDETKLDISVEQCEAIQKILGDDAIVEALNEANSE